MPRALVSLVALAACAAFAEPSRYTFVTASGPIGTLSVDEKAGVVNTTWRVDDNGRGPKLTERVELGKDGRPTRWSIEGTGEAGAPVKEDFTTVGGRAKWVRLDDQGEADAKQGFYLANNATPWGEAALLRVLMASKGNTSALLPAGTARAEKLRDVDLGTPRAKDVVTAWALWGVNVSPSFLLMRKDRLVATLYPGWVLVEDRYQGAFARLSALAAELSKASAQQLAQRIAHPIDGALWLTNVRVFDAETGKVGAPTTVGVFRERIVQVGGPAPADAQRVDGGGGTVLPGLIDAHAHLGLWDGPLHLASGVTLGRDPGNDNEQTLLLEAALARGEVVGPRMKNSGFIEGKSSFSAHVGQVVATADEARAAVRWYADHGFWGVKIYNSMNPDFVKAIADEAHRAGLHVSGHVPAFMNSERAVRDGYDEINHVNQLLLSFVIDVAKEDTRTPFRFTALGERTGTLDLRAPPFQRMLKLMKERRTVLDPTLATFSQLLRSRPGKASPTDAPWLEHMPPALQRARRSAAIDVKPEQYPPVRRVVEEARRDAGAAARQRHSAGAGDGRRRRHGAAVGARGVGAGRDSRAGRAAAGHPGRRDVPGPRARAGAGGAGAARGPLPGRRRPDAGHRRATPRPAGAEGRRVLLPGRSPHGARRRPLRAPGRGEAGPVFGRHRAVGAGPSSPGRKTS